MPCEACVRDRHFATLAMGKLRCNHCGEIFGALKTQEIEDMEELLRKAKTHADEWNLGAGGVLGAGGMLPRPSVLRRLIDEVQERRKRAAFVYATSERESSAPVEKILDDIKARGSGVT